MLKPWRYHWLRSFTQVGTCRSTATATTSVGGSTSALATTNVAPVWKPWLRPTLTVKSGASAASGRRIANAIHSSVVGAAAVAAAASEAASAPSATATP